MHFKKHFPKLPLYLAAVCFLASIPVIIYLAQNTTQSKQYAQANLTPTPTIPFNTIGDCSTNNNCPTTSPPTGVSPTPNITSSHISLTSTAPCTSCSVSVNNYKTQANNQDFIDSIISFFDRLLDQ